MPRDAFKRKPQQSRSRSVVEAVVTALDDVIDRTSDVAEISMRAVADRAGVGIGSVYDYFNGQDGLFGSFLSRLTEVNFEKMERAIDATRGLPLEVALRDVLRAAMSLYLDSPRRTSAAISFIVRLGWTGPVTRERDRFADLLSLRILHDRPELDEAHVKVTMRLVLDAGLGVIVNELWRPTPNVRTHLLELVDGMLHRRLGVHVRTED